MVYKMVLLLPKAISVSLAFDDLCAWPSLRGDLLRLLQPTLDGKGYVIAPTTALVRRTGRKEWRYSTASNRFLRRPTMCGS
jgi:hypothetical protein